MKVTLLKKSSVLFVLLLASACDLNEFNSCDWTLEPEKDNLEKLSKEDIADGYIPVCARNRMTNKQNCDLKAKLEFSKQVYQKKFKYTDLEIQQDGKFPKAIISIANFCSD